MKHEYDMKMDTSPNIDKAPLEAGGKKNAVGKLFTASKGGVCIMSFQDFLTTGDASSRRLCVRKGSCLHRGVGVYYIAGRFKVMQRRK